MICCQSPEQSYQLYLNHSVQRQAEELFENQCYQIKWKTGTVFFSSHIFKHLNTLYSQANLKLFLIKCSCKLITSLFFFLSLDNDVFNMAPWRFTNFGRETQYFGSQTGVNQRDKTIKTWETGFRRPVSTNCVHLYYTNTSMLQMKCFISQLTLCWYGITLAYTCSYIGTEVVSAPEL